jgi:hypothetical protein
VAPGFDDDLATHEAVPRAAFEHSKVYRPGVSALKINVASPRPRFGMIRFSSDPTILNP